MKSENTPPANAPVPEEKIHKILWDADQRSDSLESLYQRTVEAAQEQINWYKINRTSKRRWAQMLRITALGLLGLGGILPVIIDILTTYNISIPGSVATLIIALGTGLIILDRFMGYSTGWMRYITTEMLITSRLASFQYEWEAEEINWEGSQPTLEQARMMVNRCANLRNEIAAIVRDETQAWAEEFQSNMKMLDDKFKSLSTTNHVGAISLAVENGEHYSGGWDLLVDNQLMGNYRSGAAGFNNILPGFRNILVRAKDEDGQEILRSCMVTVEPGKLINATIKLPEVSDHPLAAQPKKSETSSTHLETDDTAPSANTVIPLDDEASGLQDAKG